MARVTILGAGDMGTALVTPLCHGQNEIRLWGTSRDDAVVSALRSGLPHPRLGVPVPNQVRVYAAAEAGDALTGAEIIVIAITSDAVRSVLAEIKGYLGSPEAIVTVAKGFDRTPRGNVQLLPVTIAEFSSSPVVAVGGPSKANEVAHGLPASVVFGSDHDRVAAECVNVFSTQVYRVSTTNDIVGLEIAAAMKNAYAIALGIPDGLEIKTGKPHHNLRAALFPQAVREMSALAEAFGGHADTIQGLSGVGDLQVTITSGRNRLLGERIGFGEAAALAAAKFAAEGTTIEGYLAAEFGYQLYQDAQRAGLLDGTGLPLLDALWEILHQDAPACETLWAAAR